MLLVTILSGGLLCLVVGGVEDDVSNDESVTHGLDESR